MTAAAKASPSPDLPAQNDEAPSQTWPKPTPPLHSIWDPDTDREKRARTSQLRTPIRAPPAPSMHPYLPPSLYPGEERSQSGIALRAFLLGSTLGMSAVLTCYFAFVHEARIWRSFFYLDALCVFHFLEFWTHARYNLPQATVSAFLLSTNGMAYNIANGTALFESIITSLFFPGWQAHWASSFAIGLGIVLTIVGQVTRSTAMAQAGTNFNHHVQNKKQDDHMLVTNGIYSYLRHPSYFGFYYWAIGTQMVTGNLFSGVAIGFVLWVFFNRRIRGEEAYLIDFFGDDYARYRDKTRTMLPLMGITISKRIKIFISGGAPPRVSK